MAWKPHISQWFNITDILSILKDKEKQVSDVILLSVYVWLCVTHFIMWPFFFLTKMYMDVMQLEATLAS
jgi:hypothetical protein